jgi:hypothetical protein
MTRRKATGTIRQETLQKLEKMLEPQALQEIRALLTLCPGDWQREYTSLCTTDFDMLSISCTSGLMRVVGYLR